MNRGTRRPMEGWASAALAAVIALAACTETAPPEQTAAGEGVPPPEEDPSGRLVIVGGSLDDDNVPVYRAVLDARQGTGPLCVLPTASGDPRRSMESAVESFRARGDAEVEGVFVSTENPEVADSAAVADRLRACSGFWFTGGSQSRIVDVFLPDGRETPAYRAVMDRYESGAVVGGSSAGAAVMSPRMIAGGDSEEALEHGIRESSEGDGVRIHRGLGFLDGLLVDQHFLARGRVGRLLVATLAGEGGGSGVGIDENTALVVDGDRAEVLGESGVVLVDARRADRTEAANGGRGVILHLLGRGDGFDLKTLEVTTASDKVALEVRDAEADPPDDPFARWAFLRVVVDLAEVSDRDVEMTSGGYLVRLTEVEGFRALGRSGSRVEGAPAGFFAGPLRLDLLPAAGDNGEAARSRSSSPCPAFTLSHPLLS